MSVADDLARARTFLFVPGDRPDRFARACASGADVVILDLEDAVGAEHKVVARRTVADFVRRTTSEEGPVISVRVNDPSSDHGAADLRELASTDVAAVVVPKVSGPDDVDAVVTSLAPGTSVLALVETAAAILALPEIAAAGTTRLLLGHLDLAAELGLDPEDDDALWPARFSLLVASAAAGLPAPVDGVPVQLRDAALAEAAARRSVRAGFGARLCVHPDQVEPIHAGLLPTQTELTWARRVLEAMLRRDVGVVDGALVDEPVLLRARSIMARAGRDHPTPSSDGRPSSKEHDAHS